MDSVTGISSVTVNISENQTDLTPSLEPSKFIMNQINPKLNLKKVA